MLRLITFTIGGLCLAGLVYLLIDHPANITPKALVGAGWGALVFFGFYFALTKEKKWKASLEYSEAKKHYATLVSAGEEVSIAEERVAKSMTLDDIADGVRSVPGVGIRKIRVSIFSDTRTHFRILSYQGRVFGSDVLPKQRRG